MQAKGQRKEETGTEGSLVLATSNDWVSSKGLWLVKGRIPTVSQGYIHPLDIGIPGSRLERDAPRTERPIGSRKYKVERGKMMMMLDVSQSYQKRFGRKKPQAGGGGACMKSLMSMLMRTNQTTRTYRLHEFTSHIHCFCCQISGNYFGQGPKCPTKVRLHSLDSVGRSR